MQQSKSPAQIAHSNGKLRSIQTFQDGVTLSSVQRSRRELLTHSLLVARQATLDKSIDNVR